jgi:hypothetical protein
MMRTDAGLHADQARGHIGKACFHLTTRPLLPQHDCVTTIEPNDVERVLTDINADYGNCTLCCRSHGVLLVLAPLASLSLAGQEHGRTIPLPDLDSQWSNVTASGHDSERFRSTPRTFHCFRGSLSLR